MFEVGEYVVYGTKGVCRVSSIEHVDMPGVDKNRLFYVLIPINKSASTVYLPIDSDKAVIRRIMTKEEAQALLKEIPQIEMLWVSDDKKRENIYKEAIKSCDCRNWVGIIKTLYLRKKNRIEAGKKITALDEKYLHAVEYELYGELSIALDVPHEEMQSYVIEQIIPGFTAQAETAR